MANRKHIPKETETAVLVKCRRRCCLCFFLDNDTAVKKGQIAHIDHDPSNAAEDNLAFLCFDHHDEYDGKTSQSKGLTQEEVKHAKAKLEAWVEATDNVGSTHEADEMDGPGESPDEFKAKVDLLERFNQDLVKWGVLSSRREFDNVLFGAVESPEPPPEEEQELRRKLGRTMPEVRQLLTDAFELEPDTDPLEGIFGGGNQPRISDLIEQAIGLYDRRNARVTSSTSPSPLVCIGPEVLAEGQRVAAYGNRWTIRIGRFLVGNSSALCRFGDDIESVPLDQRYVLLVEGKETDARPLAEFAWRKDPEGIEIDLRVMPSAPLGTVRGLRTHTLLREVEGVDAAAVLLQSILGTSWGWLDTRFGTLVGEWLRDRELEPKLDQLVRMDIARLASIQSLDDGKPDRPPLDFIKNVVSIKPRVGEAEDDAVPVELDLEFAGGGRWSGTILVATKPFDPDEHQRMVDELVAEASKL